MFGNDSETTSSISTSQSGDYLREEINERIRRTFKM